MNEKGLCFDGMATSRNPVTGSKNKPKFQGDIMDHILSECSTVEEALAVFNQYDLSFMERFQLMLCDATGESAILEGDNVIRRDGPYQICTNFYQSHYKLDDFPCRRYEIASSLFKKSEKTGPDLIRQILAAVHKEGSSPTQYSNIYDLKNATVTIYHFHNFANSVTIDVREELGKGPHMVKLEDLFPATYAAEVFKENREDRPAFEAELKKREKSIITLPHKRLTDYVGSYRLSADTIFVVTLENDCLYCKVPNWPQKAELKALAEGRFFFVNEDNAILVDLIFLRDDKGTIASMKITTDKGEWTAERVLK